MELTPERCKRQLNNLCTARGAHNHMLALYEEGRSIIELWSFHEFVNSNSRCFEAVSLLDVGLIVVMKLITTCSISV